MALRFVPLGVGDAFSELRYSSCLAVVENDGAFLLIDCPHPILKILREAREATGLPLTADRLAGVALTHLHADHASGLEGLAYYLHYALGRRLRLAVHPTVRARLWDGHLAAGMEQLLPRVGADFERHAFEDFFDVVPLDEGAAVDVAGFRVECRHTIHHIPTTALRIAAGGATLGHSADTAFDEGLIAWLAAADLFVHETNHGVHTPYARLAALPAATRAKMRLTHYPDDFDLAASVIEPLHERRVYTVAA
jgi:glyoxylase-like metal-dependent hydrolase (beta-lactamase superfamily II)